MIEIIYGTGNEAKLTYMHRALKGIPVKVVGMKQAAEQMGLVLPQIEENGNTPLENARLKAEGYFKLFRRPLFSADSGLYLWNHATGRMLPQEEQPGIHVRGREEQRFSDDELLAHYVGLVKKYGPIRARYKNALCLIWNEDIRQESMEEGLWGKAFLLTDVPHKKRVSGFPLDSISLDLKTKKYIYDLEESQHDGIILSDAYRQFFCNFLKKYDLI